MSDRVGSQIGSFLGELVVYDVGNNSGNWRQYMRVRVRLNVRKPLKQWKKIKTPQGDGAVIHFK